MQTSLLTRALLLAPVAILLLALAGCQQQKPAANVAPPAGASNTSGTVQTRLKSD